MLEHKLDMGTADLHTRYNLFMPVNLHIDVSRIQDNSLVTYQNQAALHAQRHPHQRRRQCLGHLNLPRPDSVHAAQQAWP